MAKNEVKDRQFMIRFTQKEFKELYNAAKKYDFTMTKLIKNALKLHYSSIPYPTKSENNVVKDEKGDK